MKTRTTLKLAAGLLLAMAPIAKADLPAEWYQLPEDSATRIEAPSEKTDALGRQSLTRSLDDIFEANGEALKQLDAGEKDTKWRIRALQTDLGISAKGILAPVGIKGTATVQVHWRKKDGGTGPRTDEDGQADVLLSSASTREDLRAQLEPMIKAAVKTQKVKGEDVFRRDLYDAAETFYDLTRALEADAPRTWWVSRFRLDLWVDISGKVHPNVNAGAEFKIRFDWFRLKSQGGGRPVALDSVQKKFRDFVHDLTSDARSVSQDLFNGCGFYPSSLRFALGMTASGKFGLVKFGGGVSGYLYLSTDAQAPGREVVEEPLPTSPLLYIEESPSDAHMKFARENGIPFEVEGRGPFKKLIYQLDRVKFRRGLVRSAKMSTWFAERASRIHIGKWKIYQLKPSFELSIGADWKLVSLYGTGGIEMELYNGNF